MVFIGNLIKSHQGLRNGFKIVVFYKSGRISDIKKTDKMTKSNGDLQVNRYHNGKFICTVFMDCAEIESFAISKEDLL